MIFSNMTNAVQNILQQIHHHPFNQSLYQGTLPKEVFTYYMIQDALYLADFSRALALTAARLPDNNHSHQFIKFSLGAIQAERNLHLQYFTKYQINEYLEIEQNPTCFMYTNYLLRMASTAVVEEAVSSLLPCFWIYKEVGKKMVTTKVNNHPYQDWIDLYSSDTFSDSTECAIDIVNQLSMDASDFLKAKMVAAFVRSSQLEWLFWQNAYLPQAWPIK